MTKPHPLRKASSICKCGQPMVRSTRDHWVCRPCDNARHARKNARRRLEKGTTESPDKVLMREARTARVGYEAYLARKHEEYMTTAVQVRLENWDAIYPKPRVKVSQSRLYWRATHWWDSSPKGARFESQTQNGVAGSAC